MLRSDNTTPKGLQCKGIEKSKRPFATGACFLALLVLESMVLFVFNLRQARLSELLFAKRVLFSFLYGSFRHGVG